MPGRGSRVRPDTLDTQVLSQLQCPHAFARHFGHIGVGVLAAGQFLLFHFERNARIAPRPLPRSNLASLSARMCPTAGSSCQSTP